MSNDIIETYANKIAYKAYDEYLISLQKVIPTVANLEYVYPTLASFVGIKRATTCGYRYNCMILFKATRVLNSM